MSQIKVLSAGQAKKIVAGCLNVISVYVDYNILPPHITFINELFKKI